MKNYDVVTADEDVPTKVYVDTRIAVQTAQPTNGAEIWIDTDEPDPLETLEQRIVSLEARVAELEARQSWYA